MNNMYSIALPIEQVNKQQIETWSKVEANTYDYKDINFEQQKQ